MHCLRKSTSAEFASLKAELFEAHKTTKKAAAKVETRALLGTPNRPRLERRLERPQIYRPRCNIGAAVIIIDVDDLNFCTPSTPRRRRWSHKGEATALDSMLRAPDTPGRFGDDELAALLRREAIDALEFSESATEERAWFECRHGATVQPTADRRRSVQLSRKIWKALNKKTWICLEDQITLGQSP